jgi:hypothetical protein
MAEISAWDVAAAGNGFTVPNGFPEGMQYSEVNNAAREIMAVLAREYNDRSGAIVSTGSANAYSIVSNRTLGAYAAGQRFTFRANFASTGAATLNVDALGAKAIARADGSAIIAGAIQSGAVYDVIYSITLDKFILFGGFGVDINQVAQGTTAAAGKLELGTNAETVTGTDTARVPPISALTALFNAAGRRSLSTTQSYQALPGGLLVKWGRTANLGDITGTENSSTAVFSTAIAFTAKPFVVAFPISLSGTQGVAGNALTYWDEDATTVTAAAFQYREAYATTQSNWAIGYIAVGV